MMQIEINEQTVDRQLVDAGIGKDAEEQAVRPMFFHLFCAIRYYRDMTYAEKVKAGFIYRTKFKNVYSLTGFFKERKRNRDKKSSPLHPSCLKFEPDYDRQLLLKFYCYWAEQVNGTELMLWETKKSWNMRLRLKAWSKKSYQLDDKAAALRLERAKGKKTAPQAVNTQELQALAAKRAEDNEKLDREIAARKQGAVSYEEYLNLKH